MQELITALKPLEGIASPYFAFFLFLCAFILDTITGKKFHEKLGRFNSKELKKGMADEKWLFVLPIGTFIISKIGELNHEPMAYLIMISSITFSLYGAFGDMSSALANIELITGKQIAKPLRKFFKIDDEVKEKMRRENITDDGTSKQRSYTRSK